MVPSPARDPSPPAARPADEKEQAAPEILIPAYVDPNGRDSLGRGLDEASIAAAVAADRAVQREREALPHYLAGAYRDPYAAKARLDEMVKRQGRTSTAARIARDPDPARRIARERRILRGLQGEGRACDGGAGGRRRRTQPGAHRDSGGQGRADVSRERGGPAQGRRHADSETDSAGRGGRGHIGGDYG